MADRMTLIEAPEGTQEFGHTVSYSPIFVEGRMIERYELVLEADFLPCGCAYAADPSEFREYINQWETFGKTFLPDGFETTTELINAAKTPKERSLTIKEYNEVWYPLINNSTVFLHGLEHNIKKSESPEEALANLSFLGWGPELQKFLDDAVMAYREILLKELKERES